MLSTPPPPAAECLRGCNRAAEARIPIGRAASHYTTISVGGWVRSVYDMNVVGDVWLEVRTVLGFDLQCDNPFAVCQLRMPAQEFVGISECLVAEGRCLMDLGMLRTPGGGGGGMS
jgi:hypothetical protein